MSTASTEEDDYDDDDDEKDLKLMPPPSFVPKGLKMGDGVSRVEKSSIQSSPDKGKANTPLAAMLPPELSNIDVAALFPEFRHAQVRVFSLFRISMISYRDMLSRIVFIFLVYMCYI